MGGGCGHSAKRLGDNVFSLGKLKPVASGEASGSDRFHRLCGLHCPDASLLLLDAVPPVDAERLLCLSSFARRHRLLGARITRASETRVSGGCVAMATASAATMLERSSGAATVVTTPTAVAEAALGCSPRVAFLRTHRTGVSLLKQDHSDAYIVRRVQHWSSRSKCGGNNLRRCYAWIWYELFPESWSDCCYHEPTFLLEPILGG